eukprot:Rmarinus@m.20144
MTEDNRICNGCRKPMKGGSEIVVTDEGSRYHSDCFVCCVCRKSLQSSHWFKDGGSFCESCYSERFHAKCEICGLPCTTGTVLALGKSYHTECLKCSQCHKGLLPDQTRSEYQRQFRMGTLDSYVDVPTNTVKFSLDEKGKYLCLRCYEGSVAPRCLICKDPITSAGMQLGSKNFHKACFRCSKCKRAGGELLTRGKVFDAGRVECRECFKANPIQIPFSGSSVDATAGGASEETDESDPSKCHSCEKEIHAFDERVKALGKYLHNTCFVCVSCNAKLESSGFYERDGMFCCQRCYPNNLAHRCESCKDPIRGNTIHISEHRAFHEECFKCVGCNVSMGRVAGGGAAAASAKHRRFYESEDGRTPMCQSCRMGEYEEKLARDVGAVANI